MSKVTVSGVCLAALAAADRPLTIADLWLACEQAGLSVLQPQVYAGVQSLASTRKCLRGEVKGTFLAMRDGVGLSDTKVKPVSQVLEPRRRVSGRSGNAIPNDVVLSDLESKLGPKMVTRPDRSAHCFLLLGEHDADYILERFRAVYQREPEKWFTYYQAENVVVGVL